MEQTIEAREWHFDGRVQGVGFRPFIYRLAHDYGLTGWVRNRGGRVQVLAQGPARQLQAFARKAVETPPPIARPRITLETPRAPRPLAGFHILGSECPDAGYIHLPPDQPVCRDCLAEMRDPGNRRYRYPFINCTQCGPRYSIIRSLPYDRPNTAMAGFTLCPDCQDEYEDPLDRRFHAQPLACPRCGPRLFFSHDGETIAGNEPALQAAVASLRGGGILAVKGIGGYHLVCDATNSAVVAELRRRKARPHKPLAVMFAESGPGAIDNPDHGLQTDPETLAALTAPERPIVLVPYNGATQLAPEIAPEVAEIGAMLPYSPLHHLLLEDVGAPLVFTSANRSGEPVITDSRRLRQELGSVVDALLDHDRPIERAADDPVTRCIAGRPRPLRLGRGSAPVERRLPFALKEPILAVGAQMKNTVALAWDNRVVVSPHLGDLESPAGADHFRRMIDELQRLYRVTPARVVCDAHPAFASTHFAHEMGLPVTRVQHHRAHASGLAGEYGCDHDWLVIAWDGLGYGDDGLAWGGESFVGRPGNWSRFSTIHPLRIPGANRAALEPWRSALACRLETDPSSPFTDPARELARQAWLKGMNTGTSYSMGRLFDAAAALCGLLDKASFDGQAPLWLEAASDDSRRWIELPWAAGEDVPWQLDWQPLIPVMANEQLAVATRAAIFHNSLVEAIRSLANHAWEAHGIQRVGLTGGVFQNRRLAEAAVEHLERDGFQTALPEQIPVNDAGISFGQIIEAAHLTGILIR